ncbi:MAG: L-serine ammonia-lyase, partial [Candidatus Competibacteraceae bacterium]|nr:L-serine ammonia-lyase [Candidatus Competibacteraceae bacterium]
MPISVFDLYKIGIGPSSSHTVGPMRAAREFVLTLQAEGVLEQVAGVRAELYGSLGATGKGHGSDKAVLLGLEGEQADVIDPESIAGILRRIRESGKLRLLGKREIAFTEKKHLLMHRRKSLPFHANGMRFSAFNESDATLDERVYYSVGGGFVVDEQAARGDDPLTTDATMLPYPFSSAAELLKLCAEHNASISQLVLANEQAFGRSEAEVRAELMRIWQVMQDCVTRGCQQHGILPGGMKVKRRAAQLHQQLTSHPETAMRDPLTVLDWVNLYALAVNEENAAGGRVVTAPTNG